MSPLRVHVLRFSNPSAMERAFGGLNDHPDVESCVVEVEVCQIRFIAERRISDALIERFYADGGLVWSSRHQLGGA